MNKITLFLIAAIVLACLPRQISCTQASTTDVVLKLLEAFGKCGLKVGVIDANKLHHLLQMKHGLQALDPKQIIFAAIDMLPVSRGFKMLKVTLKCGTQIAIRYVQLQAGFARVGTMYVVKFAAEIIEKACA